MTAGDDSGVCSAMLITPIVCVYYYVSCASTDCIILCTEARRVQ